MARFLALGILLAGAFGTAVAQENPPQDDGLNPKVRLETSLGDITLELTAEESPISVINFLRYTREKFYDGTVFHRVIKSHAIFGGGYTPQLDKKVRGLHPQIKNEWRNTLHNIRGTIAMARLAGKPDSARAEFYINMVDNAGLDKPRDGASYAVFGRVVDGMDVVDKIAGVHVSTHPKYAKGRNPFVPVEPVLIKSVTLLSDFNEKEAIRIAAEYARLHAMTPEQVKQYKQERFLDLVKRIEGELGIKPVLTETGLAYFDIKVGDGISPAPDDLVEVVYSGLHVDGTEFDSSQKHGGTMVQPLNGAIKGWREGVSTMKVGGKRKLVIPPELGYGSDMPPGMPRNATLIYDVELISVREPGDDN